MRTALQVCVSVALLLSALPVYAYSSPGVPSGFVNDFANVLSSETKAELENGLRDFQASTTNEVVLVTVPTLDGDVVSNYAVKLFEDWKIGTDERDNGVLLLFALTERKVRIEVGYGLEGALPDSAAESIIQEMIPYLQAEDFDGAARIGIASILVATQGEYQGTVRTEDVVGSILSIIFLGLFFIQWVAAILARSKSYWAGGLIGVVAGIVLATLLGWWFVAGMVLTVLLAGLGLLLDYGVSHAYHEAVHAGTPTPWWAGGGTGGSHSGGSFGGFWGGSSGGGGASGSW
ncbi:MAG: TPM domain-containing protein [Candidatus Pacebacteria bacterium]|nr:TPM domain-containing protein [Candidatus Paceibacterota bacterium]